MDGSFWINRNVHVFLLKQEFWFTRLYVYILHILQHMKIDGNFWINRIVHVFDFY
jgi:hypothetical protein